MNLREISEENEIERLSAVAKKSRYSKGRKFEEEECNIRTKYQRDRDRIIHSKAFRRLSHKTQVFISPHGDHFRTRLSHTLEVSQISRTIAKALNLNEDLVEAIALGHDLGHTPFGHMGEYALSEILGEKFEHNVQSLRIIEKLERNGNGLNLTFESNDGILNHRGLGTPSTLEGQVVQISDKIAYVNHDIEDAIRAKIITLDELPKDIINTLGKDSSKRINFFVTDVVVNSLGQEKVLLKKETNEMLYSLRTFMFENVYRNKILIAENDKVIHVFNQLFNYFLHNYEKIPVEHINKICDGEDKKKIVCDFIAGMTDRYAINLYNELFVPKSWKI